MERIDEGQDFLAIVDFAHTPNALAQALRTAGRWPGGGSSSSSACAGLRDRQKRTLMGRVAGELADVVVLTAEGPGRRAWRRLWPSARRRRGRPGSGRGWTSSASPTGGGHSAGLSDGPRRGRRHRLRQGARAVHVLRDSGVPLGRPGGHAAGLHGQTLDTLPTAATLKGTKEFGGVHHLGGIRQRWLVVWSAQAEQRERETLQKQVEKERERAEKAWQALCRQEFSSPGEAGAAVQALEQKWRYHRLEVHCQPVKHYARRGRPAADTVPQRVGFRLQGKVVEKAEAIAAVQKTLGKFILATNELDEQQLPAEEMLRAYKGQGVGPERGFRFLKDPWFFADSLF